MTTSFDIITGMGGRFLNNQTFIYNDDVINIMFDSSHFAPAIHFPQLLFNSSLYTPISINGTYVLSNLTTTNNPYLVTSIFGIFWLSTFLIFLIMLIPVLIYQIIKGKQKNFIKNNGIIKIKSKPNSINQCVRSTWKKTLITLMIISFLLWLIFLCLLCIEQYAVSSKISQNTTSSNDSNQYSSFTSAISSSFKYLNNMYTTITVDSLNLINSSVSSLNTSMNNQIQYSVKLFINQFLEVMEITNLFKHANIFINGLNLILDSMTYINKNKALFSIINQIKGSVSVYQQQTASDLQIICPKLETTPSLYGTCISLQKQNADFTTNIDTNQINTDSSVIMLFLIEMLQINMTSITISYQQMYNSTNEKINSIVATALSKIDVSPYLSTLTSFWQTSVIPLSSTFFNSTSNIQNQTNSAINMFYTSENIVIILLIVFIFIFVGLILISFRQSFNNKKWNKCLNFIIQLFILFFSFIGAIVAIALLLSTTYINIALCQQLNSTTGINLSDQIINKKLQQPWKQITDNLVNNNPNFPVNLMQPTNIISGISSKCRNTSIGLLTAVGMTNLINMTEVIQKSGVYTTLNDTQTSSYASFNNSGPHAMIPSDVVTSITRLRANITLLDSYNYSTSIQQLSIPLLGVTNFTQFINDLNAFAQNAKKALGSSNELSSLSNTAAALQKRLNDFNDTQNSIKIMASKYENLQNNRNNFNLASLILIDISNVTNKLSNNSQTFSSFYGLYNQTIIINMMATIIQLMSSNFTSITNQILPCNNLSLILEAATTSVCAENNLKDSLAAIGLLLIMVIVTNQFISLLMIIASIMHAKFPNNFSKC